MTEKQEATAETIIDYTAQQATEEALLLLVRKLRRLHYAAYSDLRDRMPMWCDEALRFAEMRADTLRATDAAAGIARRYVSPLDALEEEENAEA